MARTARTYRNLGRNPRYTTKMQTMANGMYLTKQVIPEGYAKKMVNYDIDDTGSYIRPRKGRTLLQTLEYPNGELGPATLTDYLYAYRHDEKEVDSIEDLVLSGGVYADPNTYFKVSRNLGVEPIYIASLQKTVDTRPYNDAGEVAGAGTVTTTNIDEFWAIRYNNSTERFEKVVNEDVGVIKARTIKNAYAFDKKFRGPVGRPVRTVLENELYTFTGVPITYKEYTANSELNNVENLGTTELTKIQLVNTGTGYKVHRERIKLYDVRPAQAMTGGYNMMSPEPYNFNNELGGALFCEAALPYESIDASTPVLSPKLGSTLHYHVLYQYPTVGRKLEYKVEQIDIHDTVTTLVDWGATGNEITTPEDLWYTHTWNSAGGYLRITIRDKEQGSSTESSCIVPNLIGLTNVDYDALELKTFDLSTCTGMITWMGCLGVYGVKSAENSIFFSDAGNTGYFPFPTNYISFENKILAVHNYLDYLLVITVDSVYIVSAGATLAQSTKRKLLDNIHIPEIDAINVAMFKDQIFFKTDTEFYVLKPNKYTADATDLKNYSNSTALINFTTNFTKEVVDILNDVYKPIWQYATIHNDDHKQIRFEDFDVLDTRSVAKDAEIHYIYTIVPRLTKASWTKAEEPNLGKLNLHIIYNTLTRSWRMYTVAVGDDTVDYNPVYYRNKQSGSYEEFFTHPIEGGSAIDVIKQTYDNVSDNYTSGDFNLTSWFNNYPYIDTGNIDIDDAFTKRFREVQFNLVNKEKEFIRFYTDFKLDGLETISATHYDIAHVVDPNDPDYGTIWITPIEYTNLDLVGLTTLSNEEEYDKIKLENSTSDLWNLDLSKFPDLNVITVRFELQGRGRRGSIQLLNTSLEKYELSNLTWVYRIMNAR